ncbi:hypothetical protein Tco_0918834 [Tanacetum coccineum]
MAPLTSTSAAPAMTQAAIRKLVADSVAAALEAQVIPGKYYQPREHQTKRNSCARKVQLYERLHSEICYWSLPRMLYPWWTSFAGLSNEKLRFQELAVLCPTMVPNSDKLMDVLPSGIYPESIEGNVNASKPQLWRMPLP